MHACMHALRHAGRQAGGLGGGGIILTAAKWMTLQLERSLMAVISFLLSCLSWRTPVTLPPVTRLLVLA